MFKNVKNILVIKLRHIGDVLLTVPAIRALKEAFPDACISALVNAGTEEMLTGNPLLFDVIGYDRSQKGKLVPELEFIREIRAREYDLVVDLTGGDRPALIGFLSGARYRLGYKPKGGFIGKRLLYSHLAPRPVERTHTVIRDLGVVRHFGMGTDDLSVEMHTSPEEDLYAFFLLKDYGIDKDVPFIHVHPTSRWLFKCWKDEHMAYVMDKLQEEGLKVVLTSGPAEAELKRINSILSLMKTKPVDLTGKLKLKRLASISRKAALFFGVDSAPMHIAAAVGTKVVGLFGPSGAFDWGPWDNEAASLWLKEGGTGSPYELKNGLQSFGKNTVIQKDWDCAPCGKDGCNGTKKSDCLDALEPDYVLEVIRASLKKTIQKMEA